jgi:hypothetical protein
MIEDIRTVGIRVNNGKQAVIEIDTMNFLLIEYRDTVLNIYVPRHVPFYE